MKRLAILAGAALLAACGGFPRVVRADEGGRVIEIDPDSYAAVTYSPSTREVHYAFGFDDRRSAEQAALHASPAQDARVVGWVNEGFIAVALGDDKSVWGYAYRYGDGASLRDAEQAAIAECQKRTTGAHLVISLSSDGQVFWKAATTPVAKSAGTSTNPGRTTVITNPDGSSVEQRADGAEIIRNADGSSVEKRADRTKIVRNADGSSVETRPDGTEIVTNKDGSSVQTNPDGSEIITDAHGNKTYKKAGEKDN